MGGSYGSEFDSVLVGHLLGPLGLSGLIAGVSWTHSYSKQSTASECPPSPTTHSHPHIHVRSLIHAIHDITVAVRRVVHNPAVLASKQKCDQVCDNQTCERKLYHVVFLLQSLALNVVLLFSRKPNKLCSGDRNFIVLASIIVRS